MLGFQRRNGKECGTAAVCPLQIRNGCFAICFAFHYDLLHCRAQRDLNSNGIFILRADQLGYGAMDIAKRSPLGLLHHLADGLIIAFQVLCHGTENPGLSLDTLQGILQFLHLLGQFLCPLLTGGLPQSVACNGILVGSNFLTGLPQFLTAGIQIVLGFRFFLFTGGNFLQQLLFPLAGFPIAGFHGTQVRFPDRQIRGQLDFPGSQFHELAGNALGVGRHGIQFLLQVCQFNFLGGKQYINLSDARFNLGHLGSDTAGAILLAFDVCLAAAHIFFIIGNRSTEHRDLSIDLLMGTFQHADFDTKILHFFVLGPQVIAQLLSGCVEIVQVVMSLLQHEGCGCKILFCLFGIGREFLQLFHPDSHFHALQFFPQSQVLDGLFRLLPQRLQLQFQFGDLISDSQQIVLRMGKLALCFLFAVTVFGNTRCLFENFTPVSTLQRQDLIDSSLTDIGIALLAQAGVHKQLMDVTQAGRLAVNIKFTVTGAVIPPGNHHFICFIGQFPVAVIQRQSRFGKTYGTPLLGTAENHVFHLRTAKSLGALLAHDPQKCIGNIGFAGTVGTYDGSNITVKTDQGLIGKGLETLNFQRF